MSELGKRIRTEVRKAVDDAGASSDVNVASAVNVGGRGHSTSVYSDGEVTVVTTDGKTEVVRHRDAPDAP